MFAVLFDRDKHLEHSYHFVYYKVLGELLIGHTYLWGMDFRVCLFIDHCHINFFFGACYIFVVGLDCRDILSAKFSVFLQPSQQKILSSFCMISFLLRKKEKEHITFYFCHCEAESPTCTTYIKLPS